MKKEYLRPQILVQQFENTSVICASQPVVNNDYVDDDSQQFIQQKESADDVRRVGLSWQEPVSSDFNHLDALWKGDED